MFALTLTLALLATSASARSLRMPESRLTSLEGMAVDADGDAVARPARHALDFAVFDRPLSVNDDPHHRIARGAAEACDCTDNPDLVGEIVETAPEMEDETEAPVGQQPQPQQTAEFVEEDLYGGAISSDDAQLEDDKEATLSEGGLEPLNEAGDEAGAGRPARQTGVDIVEADDQVVAAKKEEDSEAEAETSEDIPETEGKTAGDIPEAEDKASGDIPEAEVKTAGDIPEAEDKASGDIPETEVKTPRDIPVVENKASVDIPETKAAPKAQITPASEDEATVEEDAE